MEDFSRSLAFFAAHPPHSEKEKNAQITPDPNFRENWGEDCLRRAIRRNNFGVTRNMGAAEGRLSGAASQCSRRRRVARAGALPVEPGLSHG